MGGDVTRVELDRLGLDGQGAAGRHRVARVHREVDDHLLDLAAVGSHEHQVGIEHRDERQVFTEQPLQQRLHSGDDLVHVEHGRLQHLLAAERQQLLGEQRRPLRRLLDLFDVFPMRSRQRRVLEQEERVPEDRREHVC